MRPEAAEAQAIFTGTRYRARMTFDFRKPQVHPFGVRLRVSVLALVFVASTSVGAQRDRATPSDLQGTWSGGTLTPLQRPDAFKDKSAFTPEEAADWVRHAADRLASRLPSDTDRLFQPDVDDTYVEFEAMPLDGLRTSLIVDPPDGRLPPLLPQAQARIAARPKRTFEDPETLTLTERCLVGNPPIGGSSAIPPLLPGMAFANYFQIVQTDRHVMIFSEIYHDVRVVRLNGVHLPDTITQWLGDSIGRWEGPTLVVDTTNFRADTHNADSSDRLHVVERFTRIDQNTLRYQVTVEDPQTWPRPWTAEWPFLATSNRLFETACHEGNYSVENTLRGARAEEQRQLQR
jgi:hypothetical protein